MMKISCLVCDIYIPLLYKKEYTIPCVQYDVPYT